jgi:hypothetical protein
MIAILLMATWCGNLAFAEDAPTQGVKLAVLKPRVSIDGKRLDDDLGVHLATMFIGELRNLDVAEVQDYTRLPDVERFLVDLQNVAPLQQYTDKSGNKIVADQVLAVSVLGLSGSYSMTATFIDVKTGKAVGNAYETSAEGSPNKILAMPKDIVAKIKAGPGIAPVPLPPANTPVPPEARKALAQAQAEFNAGNAENALFQISKAMKAAPTHPLVLSRSADLFHKMNDEERELNARQRWLDAAPAEDPDFAAMAEYVAATHKAASDRAKTDDLLKKAVGLDSRENARAGLVILQQLLHIDPGNSRAADLKQKLEAYQFEYPDLTTVVPQIINDRKNLFIDAPYWGDRAETNGFTKPVLTAAFDGDNLIGLSSMAMGFPAHANHYFGRQVYDRIRTEAVKDCKEFNTSITDSADDPDRPSFTIIDKNERHGEILFKASLAANGRVTIESSKSSENN